MDPSEEAQPDFDRAFRGLHSRMEAYEARQSHFRQVLETSYLFLRQQHQRQFQSLLQLLPPLYHVIRHLLSIVETPKHVVDS